MSVAVFTVVATGMATDGSGRGYPSVSIDATAHPEVNDLARLDGAALLIDLRTEVARTGDVVVLGFRMANPDETSFVLHFDLTTDAGALHDAADAGRLRLVASDEVGVAHVPAMWVELDIDGEALAQHLK